MRREDIMLKVLSEEEELRIRKNNFAKLTQGLLFDLGGRRYFIAVKKIDEKTWEVVELTESNKEKILCCFSYWPE